MNATFPGDVNETDEASPLIGTDVDQTAPQARREIPRQMLGPHYREEGFELLARDARVRT